jgi:hypothetical protein
LQLRVLRLGFFQDGDVWVCVFPEAEEILIGGAGFGGVAGVWPITYGRSVKKARVVCATIVGGNWQRVNAPDHRKKLPRPALRLSYLIEPSNPPDGICRATCLRGG